MTATQTTPFDPETVATTLARPGASVEVKKRGDGAWVELPSGWTVSVQWGYGNYCDNYDMRQITVENVLAGNADAPACATAEVALWRSDSKADLVRWADGETVQGYQTWDQVQRLIDLAADDAVPEPAALD